MRRCRGEAGQVAGIEAVPFGLLVLAVGALLVAHTWAVVDAKLLATTAAHEAGRAFVEAPSAESADAGATQAAEAVASGSGRTALPLTVTGHGGFGRCRTATFEVRIQVPGIGVPWRPDRPAIAVRGWHREVVDPYRDGLVGRAVCG